VQRLWDETLGDQFLVRPRLSRIRHEDAYLSHPLRIEEVVRHLGLVESLRCALSAARARMRSRGGADDVRGVGHAARRPAVLRHLLPLDTEKVRGIAGRDPERAGGAADHEPLALAGLIEEFHYPRLRR